MTAYEELGELLFLNIFNNLYIYKSLRASTYPFFVGDTDLLDLRLHQFCLVAQVLIHPKVVPAYITINK